MYIFNQYIGGVFYVVEDHLGGEKMWMECNLSRGFNTAGKGEGAQRERTLLKDPPPCGGRPPPAVHISFGSATQLCSGSGWKSSQQKMDLQQPVTHTTDAH